MVAFLQWLFITPVSLVAAMLVSESVYSSRQRKKFLQILFWTFFTIAIFSPVYFEFSDFIESVPVSFSERGAVVEHSYGMFTVPFSDNYTNVPTRASRADVVADIDMSDRTAPTLLVYRVSAEVADLQKFFAVPDRRKKWSRELSVALDSLALQRALSYLESNPVSIKKFFKDNRDAWEVAEREEKEKFFAWIGLQQEQNGIAYVLEYIYLTKAKTF